MNPFEMVLGIIIVVTIGTVLKARYGITKDRHGNEIQLPFTSSNDSAESARLREDIKALRERIQVLERVITDNESSSRIDREIEKLRDKNNV